MTVTTNAAVNITLLLEIFKENYPVEYWKNCCFFDERNLEDINVHWLKFKPPNREYFYGLVVLYFIIMIVGVTGNLTVIVMYFR